MIFLHSELAEGCVMNYIIVHAHLRILFCLMNYKKRSFCYLPNTMPFSFLGYVYSVEFLKHILTLVVWCARCAEIVLLPNIQMNQTKRRDQLLRTRRS